MPVSTAIAALRYTLYSSLYSSSAVLVWFQFQCLLFGDIFFPSLPDVELSRIYMPTSAGLFFLAWFSELDQGYIMALMMIVATEVEVSTGLCNELGGIDRLTFTFVAVRAGIFVLHGKLWLLYTVLPKVLPSTHRIGICNLLFRRLV